MAWLLCAHVEASSCVVVWAEASRAAGFSCGRGGRACPACSRAGRRALAAVSGEAEFLGLPRRALLELVQSEELAGWAAERAGGRAHEAAMGRV